MTGCPIPELAAVDAAVTDLMCDNGIEAGVVAVSRNGVVVYARGFGWANATRGIATPPDAMMRIASVSKPITAAAVRVLIDDGLLTLDTRAFDLGQPGGGVLDLEPFPALVDTRLRDVTIEHLLAHRGGWDRSIAGDLTYREISIAAAMGVPSPPGRENTVRYILGQPLQFAPGQDEEYSNIGYLVLGLIVEQIAGVPLIDFIHDHVLVPAGAEPFHHRAGRTFATDQDPREPFYDHPSLATNVFDPAGPLVPAPYGAWDHEARVGQGGQIATTRAILAFLDDRYVSGPSIGLPLTGNEAPSWRRNHTGSLAGTDALARQRGDGVDYAVIFNKRPNSGSSYAAQIRTRLDAIFDAGIIVWPDEPIGNCLLPGDLNYDGFVNIFDIVAVIQAIGSCNACGVCPADLNGDCTVNFFDIMAVIRELR